MSNSHQVQDSPVRLAATITPEFFKEAVKPFTTFDSVEEFRVQIVLHWNDKDDRGEEKYKARAELGPLYIDTLFENIMVGNASEQQRVVDRFEATLKLPTLTLGEFKEKVPNKYHALAALVGNERSNVVALGEKYALNRLMKQEIDMVGDVIGTLKLDSRYITRFEEEMELFGKRKLIEQAFSDFVKGVESALTRLDELNENIDTLVEQAVQFTAAEKEAAAKARAESPQKEKTNRARGFSFFSSPGHKKSHRKSVSLDPEALQVTMQEQITTETAKPKDPDTSSRSRRGTFSEWTSRLSPLRSSHKKKISGEKGGEISEVPDSSEHFPTQVATPRTKRNRRNTKMNGEGFSFTDLMETQGGVKGNLPASIIQSKSAGHVDAYHNKGESGVGLSSTK